MRLAALIAAALALAVTTAAGGVGPSLPNVAGAVSADEVSYAVSLQGRDHDAEQARGGSHRGARDAPGRLGPPDRHAHVLGTRRSQPRRAHARARRQRPADGRAPRRAPTSPSSTRESSPSSARSPCRASTRSTRSSPDGRWLYLIHHVVSTDNRYQVKAYDLKAGRLLPGAIADKRQAGWLMTGYPVARVTSSDAPLGLHLLPAVRQLSVRARARHRQPHRRLHRPPVGVGGARRGDRAGSR